MKIAFFVAEFPVLSETFVIRQVAGMVRAGHEVTVIAGQWGDRALTHGAYRECGLEERVVVLRPPGGRAAQMRALAQLAARALGSGSARRALRTGLTAALQGSRASLFDIAGMSGRSALGRFDAVIAHFGQAGVRAMHLQQAGLLAGPLATIFHGFDVSDRATLARLRKGYQALYAHCARLLPISHLWQSRLRDWGAPAGKIEVLRMGVDVASLSLLSPQRPLHRPLRVLSVARLTEKKGIAYAINGVRAASSEIHFRIIGSGPEENGLRASASELPAGKRIEFLGRRPHAEVFEQLAWADVFLLPSVTASGGDMEGIPVALMEAMAKGVLVLATRHSGIPELIDNGQNGFLVPERDATAIAAGLDRLAALADPGEIREAARRKVEMAFDEAQLLGQLERICRSMAGAADRSGPEPRFAEGLPSQETL
ncbi:MAG: glycosyltransferase [Rhodocyclaceae bacterium]|nr:glycosyltransferase [Rhodocyclaceae bacterium]